LYALEVCFYVCLCLCVCVCVCVVRGRCGASGRTHEACSKVQGINPFLALFMDHTETIVYPIVVCCYHYPIVACFYHYPIHFLKLSAVIILIISHSCSHSSFPITIALVPYFNKSGKDKPAGSGIHSPHYLRKTRHSRYLSTK